MIVLLAGDQEHITPGQFRGFQCLETCAFIVVNWLTIEGGCQSLNAHAQTWRMTKEGNQRAASCFPLSASEMSGEWKRFVYYVTNNVYNSMTGGDFSFDVPSDEPFLRGIKSTAWRYDEDISRGVLNEGERGIALANLAAAARVFQNKENLAQIGDIPARNWARMIKWVQAAMGTPEYTLERQRAHGPPRRSKRLRGWGGRPRGSSSRGGHDHEDDE
jgi:hypothetical protein